MVGCMESSLSAIHITTKDAGARCERQRSSFGRGQHPHSLTVGRNQ